MANKRMKFLTRTKWVCCFISYKFADDFFIDPEQEEQKVETDAPKDGKISNTKANNFRPYEERGYTIFFCNIQSFYVQGMYQSFAYEQSFSGYQEGVPSIYEQRQLDPKTWKSNVNFVPIPSNRNKLLHIIHKTSEELQQQSTSIDDTANMERFEKRQRMTTRDERRRVKELKQKTPYERPVNAQHTRL